MQPLFGCGVLLSPQHTHTEPSETEQRVSFGLAHELRDSCFPYIWSLVITYYLVVFWMLLTFYSAFIVVFSGRFDLNNLALGNRNKDS